MQYWAFSHDLLVQKRIDLYGSNVPLRNIIILILSMNTESGNQHWPLGTRGNPHRIFPCLTLPLWMALVLYTMQNETHHLEHLNKLIMVILVLIILWLNKISWPCSTSVGYALYTAGNSAYAGRSATAAAALSYPLIDVRSTAGGTASRCAALGNDPGNSFLSCLSWF